MVVYIPKKFIFSILCLLFITVQRSEAALSAHYYDQTCPQVEKIVAETVLNASKYDPKSPARLLRMFFHDCFIRVCTFSFLSSSLICVLIIITLQLNIQYHIITRVNFYFLLDKKQISSHSSQKNQI